MRHVRAGVVRFPPLLDEPMAEDGRLKVSTLDRPGSGVTLSPACNLSRPHPH